jgi:NADH:ubiquinone oxidoreductase subunit
MCDMFRNFFNKLAGADEFGNKYYISKFGKDYLGRESRFVIYNGKEEPSKVPPQWHSWLHHLSNEAIKAKKYKWQKDHMPNLTGTKLAYGPEKYGIRPRISADYIPWFPWRDK